MPETLYHLYTVTCLSAGINQNPTHLSNFSTVRRTHEQMEGAIPPFVLTMVEALLYVCEAGFTTNLLEPFLCVFRYALEAD